MKARIEIDQNFLVVFRTTRDHLTYKLFLSLFLVLFAILFIFAIILKADPNWVVVLIGFVAITPVFFILKTEWKDYLALDKTEHVVSFSMNKDQISHTPYLNRERYEYLWSAISKIVFTDCLINRRRDPEEILAIQEYENRNVILIYPKFEGTLNLSERTMRNLLVSPFGHPYIMITYPVNEGCKYLEGVRRFAEQRVEVKSYKKIFFDSCTNEERYVE